MKRKHFNATQGVRSDRYSGSKYTNWTEFDPINSAIDKIYSKHYDELENEPKYPKYFVETIHSNFIMPVTTSELTLELGRVPGEYTEGLKGVFLLGGSKKEEKVFFSQLSYYGTYWSNCIFIHPYPKKNLERYYKPPPRPHVLNDYKRVGALVKQDHAGGLTVHFTTESLKQFYLRDVFIHEIGHHFDDNYSKGQKKREGFADWFATEYGFKYVL